MVQKKYKELRDLTRILARNLEAINATDCCINDISSAQCHALVEIGRKKDSMLKDLAAILLIDVSTASKVVEELVKKGLVNRVPSRIDRRSVQIALTEEGEALFHRIENNMDLLFEKIFNNIENSEQENLLHSLAIYNKAIEQWTENAQSDRGN